MLRCVCLFCVFFFFNDTATTEIYTLSLHDALPISGADPRAPGPLGRCPPAGRQRPRSEEHPSELQSNSDLVCRLLLEKKQKNTNHAISNKKIKSNRTVDDEIALA